MIIGRRYWIFIWYGILALGLVGLASSVFWGRATRWRNLDEILRAVGTVCVSVGMLVLLNSGVEWVGESLLAASLISFVLALFLGLPPKGNQPPEEPGGDDQENYPGPEPKGPSQS